MYALRDSEGKFVARARTSAAAHRSSRRARHLGASVNRVGGVDPHALKAAKSDLRFARKHGSLMIAKTKVGTVEVRWSQPHQQFVLTQLGTPTSPPLGLATGNTAQVAPVLASLYIVEYANRAGSSALTHRAPTGVHPADRGAGNIAGLHHRIAVALGWSDEAVRSFSLLALRDIVRPVDPALANEISQTLVRGEHIMNRAVGDLPIRITKTVYRDQHGFLVSGKGRGIFRTRIFTTKRENAEAIRDAVRRDDHDAISRILLAESYEAGRI